MKILREHKKKVRVMKK